LLPVRLIFENINNLEDLVASNSFFEPTKLSTHIFAANSELISESKN